MELYDETKNNYNGAITHLNVFGLLELGCIYCIHIYNVERKMDLYYNNNSIQCGKCGRRCVIPIIPNSLLVKKYYNNNDRLNVMRDLNTNIYPLSKL